MPAALQFVQRPDHAGSTDVEVLQRQRCPPAVPLLSRPEPVVIECGGGIRGDRGDRIADSRRIPGLVDQGLELIRFVEDRASLVARTSTRRAVLRARADG